MRKWVLLAMAGMLVCAGCGQKSDSMDDQLQGPEAPSVVEEALQPTPEPEVDEAALREEQLQQDATMALRAIYFSYDSFILTEGSRDVLAGVGDFMAKYAEVALRVEGHCDERGSDEYNMALGQKRADEARRYLTTYGVEGSRVTTVSWGEERAASEGHDEDAWSQNRRDEFSYEKR